MDVIFIVKHSAKSLMDNVCQIFRGGENVYCLLCSMRSSFIWSFMFSPLELSVHSEILIYFVPYLGPAHKGIIDCKSDKYSVRIVVLMQAIS